MSDDIEPTSRGRIVSIIKSKIQLPRIGRVTAVREHTSSNDYSNHEVDVQIPPGGKILQEHNNVPVHVPIPQSAIVPREGDIVKVGYYDGNAERPFVESYVYASDDSDRAPLGTEGVMRINRGSMYLEFAPDGSWGRIASKGSDDGTPDAKIELQSDGTINIETNGNDVVVNGGGNSVAKEGDAVSGTTSDGATFSGTIDTVDNDIEVS